MFFYVANVNFLYCGRSFIQVDRIHINRPLQISGCLRRRRVRRRRGGVRHVAQLRGRGARAAERMEVAFPPVAETSSRMVGVLTPRL